MWWLVVGWSRGSRGGAALAASLRPDAGRRAGRRVVGQWGGAATAAPGPPVRRAGPPHNGDNNGDNIRDNNGDNNGDNIGDTRKSSALAQPQVRHRISCGEYSDFPLFSWSALLWWWVWWLVVGRSRGRRRRCAGPLLRPDAGRRADRGRHDGAQPVLLRGRPLRLVLVLGGFGVPLLPVSGEHTYPSAYPSSYPSAIPSSYPSTYRRARFHPTLA
ncbi:hypothetical protein GCM10010518_59070 [Kitasatospora cinereorecta]